MRPTHFLLVLLPLTIAVTTALAWQRSGRDRYAALEREGAALARVVRGAAIEAAETVTLAEQDLARRMASVARLADFEVAATREESADVLQRIATAERVGRIFLLDEARAVIAAAAWPPAVTHAKDGLLGSEQKRGLEAAWAIESATAQPVRPGETAVEGIRTNVFGTRERFGVLYGRKGGGTLLIRAEARHLAELRAHVGLRPLLERIVRLPAVDAVGVRAATPAETLVVEAAPADRSGAPHLRAALSFELAGGARYEAEVQLSRRGADRAVSDSRQAIVWGALLALLVSFGAALALVWKDAANRRAQAAAAARLEEERRLAEMGAMAGLVTHEINNPLNAVRLGLRVLQEAETPADRARVLATLNEEVDRMARTLEGYMGLAHEETRQRRLIQPDILEDVVRATADEAARRRIALGVRVAPDAAAVDGDPVVLTQALSNLVRNALQASPEGAAVQIEWTRAADGRNQITVRDHGPGFPQDRAALLRLGGGARGPGHGLGLPLTKRFIDAHGGRLELADAPGGGALAIVSLPARRKGDDTRD